MKKILSLLLLLSLTLCLFSGCGEKEEVIAISETTAASEVETQASPVEPGAPVAGTVYFLNCNPQTDSAWQRLGKIYSAATGVSVRVDTVEPEAYDAALATAMSGSDKPTLFQCGDLADLEVWKDCCLPLDGTNVLGEMLTTDLNLKGEDGLTYAVAYSYEAYGLIVNEELLDKVRYDVDDIRDFDELEEAVEDITDSKERRGFSAFTSAGLVTDSAGRFTKQLAALPLHYEGVGLDAAAIDGTYLSVYKNVWDLYINNATCEPSEIGNKTADDAINEFINGEAVFYQGGSWDYDALIQGGMDPEKLAMIPIYCGVNGEEDAGLCCGTDNHWAVNAKVSPESQMATLDFLYWVVTSEEGTQMLAEQFGISPYENALPSENVFLNNANELFADGCYNISWAYSYAPDLEIWGKGVAEALLNYSTHDGSWSDMTTAFVNDWAMIWEIKNS